MHLWIYKTYNKGMFDFKSRKCIFCKRKEYYSSLTKTYGTH